jgi:hypothetical protein
MSKRRATTGQFSNKTPGLPNTDPKRADAKLRDFSAPPPPKASA